MLLLKNGVGWETPSDVTERKKPRPNLLSDLRLCHKAAESLCSQQGDHGVMKPLSPPKASSAILEQYSMVHKAGVHAPGKQTLLVTSTCCSETDDMGVELATAAW